MVNDDRRVGRVEPHAANLSLLVDPRSGGEKDGKLAGKSDDGLVARDSVARSGQLEDQRFSRTVEMDELELQLAQAENRRQPLQGLLRSTERN